MPIAISPDETFRIVLKSDQGKPPAQQPFFEFRCLSCREWKEVVRAITAMLGSDSGEEAIDKTLDILRKGLVGWGNMKDPATGEAIPYEPANLDTLLILDEAQELLVRFRDHSPSEEDKKKFDSPSPSNTDTSARVVPDRRSARTSPTKFAPLRTTAGNVPAEAATPAAGPG